MNRAKQKGRASILAGRSGPLAMGLAAIGLLVTNERGVEEMAARLEIQKRTAYRLLQSIESAGLEVQARRDGSRVFHRIPAASLKQALGI